MYISYSLDPQLERYQSGIERLSGKDAHAAYARALNRTVRTARTGVVRATVKQSSIPRRIVTRQVWVRTIRPGSGSPLEVSIQSSGDPVALKEFRARQFGYGVRATIFGKSQRFEGMFIYAGSFRSGKFVAAGHVFQRSTSQSLPIEKQTGPAVPEQIVRDQAKGAFDQAVSTTLPRRVVHEVGRLLPT